MPISEMLFLVHRQNLLEQNLSAEKHHPVPLHTFLDLDIHHVPFGLTEPIPNDAFITLYKYGTSLPVHESPPRWPNLAFPK
jgi:hypothetical protein